MVVDIKNVEPNQAEDIYIKNFEFVNFRKGSLNFVCARVGNCKTQTLLNMFLQLSMVTEKDYNAVFFSLEMLKEDLKARLISMDKDWITKINPKSEFVIDDTNRLSFDQIRTLTEVWEFEHDKKLDFVFIDYVQLIEGEYEDTSIALCEWAKTTGKIIICAAQLLTSYSIKVMKDVSAYLCGTNRYAKDASILIAVNKAGNDKLWMDVGKNRNGKQLDNPLQMDFESTGLIMPTIAINKDTVNNKRSTRMLNIWGAVLCLLFNLKYGEYLEDQNNELILRPNFERSTLKKSITYWLTLSCVINKIKLQDAWKNYRDEIQQNVFKYKAEEYELLEAKSVSSLTPSEMSHFKQWMARTCTKARDGINLFIDQNKGLIDIIAGIQTIEKVVIELEINQDTGVEEEVEKTKLVNFTLGETEYLRRTFLWQFDQPTIFNKQWSATKADRFGEEE